MSRKMNPHVASSPSSSQRLWDFLSLANIWLSWKRVILSWGVSSLWPGCTEQGPWFTEPLRDPGSHLLPWALPVTVQVPQWVGVLWADRETSHPKSMDGFPLCLLALFSSSHTKFIRPSLHMVWTCSSHTVLASELLLLCFCETFLPLCVAQPEQHILNCSFRC